MKKLIVLFFTVFTVYTIASQTVFITPKGKKYHSTRNCPSLSRSKTILEINISEVGFREPCKRCH